MRRRKLSGTGSGAGLGRRRGEHRTRAARCRRCGGRVVIARCDQHDLQLPAHVDDRRRIGRPVRVRDVRAGARDRAALPLVGRRPAVRRPGAGIDADRGAERRDAGDRRRRQVRDADLALGRTRIAPAAERARVATAVERERTGPATVERRASNERGHARDELAAERSEHRTARREPFRCGERAVGADARYHVEPVIGDDLRVAERVQGRRWEVIDGVVILVARKRSRTGLDHRRAKPQLHAVVPGVGRDRDLRVAAGSADVAGERAERREDVDRPARRRDARRGAVCEILGNGRVLEHDRGGRRPRVRQPADGQPAARAPLRPVRMVADHRRAPHGEHRRRTAVGGCDRDAAAGPAGNVDAGQDARPCDHPGDVVANHGVLDEHRAAADADATAPGRAVAVALGDHVGERVALDRAPRDGDRRVVATVGLDPGAEERLDIHVGVLRAACISPGLGRAVARTDHGRDRGVLANADVVERELTIAAHLDAGATGVCGVGDAAVLHGQTAHDDRAGAEDVENAKPPAAVDHGLIATGADERDRRQQVEIADARVRLARGLIGAEREREEPRRNVDRVGVAVGVRGQHGAAQRAVADDARHRVVVGRDRERLSRSRRERHRRHRGDHCEHSVDPHCTPAFERRRHRTPDPPARESIRVHFTHC